MSSGVEPLLTQTLLITSSQNQAYFGPRPDEAPQVTVETRQALAYTSTLAFGLRVKTWLMWLWWPSG